MGRIHFYTDRAQTLRVTKKIIRGEVAEDQTVLGPEIPCVLVHEGGREDKQEGRTYLPHGGTLHFLKYDVHGDPVVLKQGDLLIVYKMTDGEVEEEPQKYKITGEIKSTRRNSEVVSYTAQVRMDTEH